MSLLIIILDKITYFSNIFYTPKAFFINPMKKTSGWLIDIIFKNKGP